MVTTWPGVAWNGTLSDQGLAWPPAGWQQKLPTGPLAPRPWTSAPRPGTSPGPRRGTGGGKGTGGGGAGPGGGGGAGAGGGGGGGPAGDAAGGPAGPAAPQQAASGRGGGAASRMVSFIRSPARTS